MWIPIRNQRPVTICHIEELLIGRAGMVAFSFFFAVHIWRHANQVLLLGFDDEKWVAKAIVIEASIVIAGMWTVLHVTTDLAYVYGGLALSLLLVSGWVFPTRFRHLMRESEEQSVLPPTENETTGLVQRTDPVGS